MVWEPKSCCGCCRPQVGAKILGILGIICCVLNILGAIRTATMSKEQLEKMCLEQGEMMDVSTCVSTAGKGLIIGISEEVIRGIISAMLVYGVQKNNECLMLPFMIFQVIGIVLIGLATLAAAIFFALFAKWLGSFIVLLIGAGIMFFSTYCFLVVRVCYKEAKESKRIKDTEIEVGFLSHREPPPPAYKM